VLFCWRQPANVGLSADTIPSANWHAVSFCTPLHEIVVPPLRTSEPPPPQIVRALPHASPRLIRLDSRMHSVPVRVLGPHAVAMAAASNNPKKLFLIRLNLLNDAWFAWNHACVPAAPGMLRRAAGNIPPARETIVGISGAATGPPRVRDSEIPKSVPGTRDVRALGISAVFLSSAAPCPKIGRSRPEIPKSVPGDPMAITVYHYPKCSTCRKALQWLEAHGVAYDKIDLVEKPPSAGTLRDLHARSKQPIGRLFNVSGESYRAGNFKERLKTLSERDALAALAKDGKLIKRPLVDTGTTVLVGFDEDAYRAAFA
jgi:arsenate reductase